jgi:hypothetical protein
MILRLPLILGLLLVLAGCVTRTAEPTRPGHTTLGSPLIIVPALKLGNYLLVEARWDRRGPYHFLVDTGSSTTLVTPELAARYPGRNLPPGGMPPVRVRSATGETALLPATTIRRLELGEARFEDVPVLVHDLRELSAHFGMKIDGILGFQLFRETVMTLDYPQSRLLLQRPHPAPLHPGTALPLDPARRVPFVQLKLGEQEIGTLIDSGSDATLSLNLEGLTPDFAAPPRPGALVGTLTGDHLQQLGRWRAPLRIGPYEIPSPVVDVTETFSSLGGGILRHFTVTFDQARNRVIFHRETHDPVALEIRRSSGLSFTRFPAYWRVAGVVPGSPAAAAGVQAGDLVTRINDEPVARWNFSRFEQLVADVDEIRFRFLNGTRETERVLPVFAPVP